MIGNKASTLLLQIGLSQHYQLITINRAISHLPLRRQCVDAIKKKDEKAEERLPTTHMNASGYRSLRGD